ncbi:hypothetical protein CEXT_414581 [Caerostris extrusa]|uniref:Uncharacterized protein n=1 Tax=Caerostris extrusa TaxID=172846 RepID=A0AAV4VX34_CAEEX|nr:hypothetical protein CEXT_414581 [Caerostris extrusa]
MGLLSHLHASAPPLIGVKVIKSHQFRKWFFFSLPSPLWERLNGLFSFFFFERNEWNNKRELVEVLNVASKRKENVKIVVEIRHFICCSGAVEGEVPESDVNNPNGPIKIGGIDGVIKPSSYAAAPHWGEGCKNRINFGNGFFFHHPHHYGRVKWAFPSSSWRGMNGIIKAS